MGRKVFARTHLRDWLRKRIIYLEEFADWPRAISLCPYNTDIRNTHRTVPSSPQEKNQLSHSNSKLRSVTFMALVTMTLSSNITDWSRYSRTNEPRPQRRF